MIRCLVVLHVCQAYRFDLLGAKVGEDGAQLIAVLISPGGAICLLKGGGGLRVVLDVAGFVRLQHLEEALPVIGHAVGTVGVVLSYRGRESRMPSYPNVKKVLSRPL